MTDGYSASPGSEEQGMHVLGFARNLGDPIISTEIIPEGELVDKKHHTNNDVLLVIGINKKYYDGIAKRRKRIAARWIIGNRSISILVMKPGN